MSRTRGYAERSLRRLYLVLGALVVQLAALAACDEPWSDASPGTPAGTSLAPASPMDRDPPAPAPAVTERAAEIVLVAGGDVDFGRARGQRLLGEPQRDDFAGLRHLLDGADVRFVNLESPISDRGGETQSPASKLVFTAPPGTEYALSRARIDVVSLANNHAWDYGRDALLETLARLDGARVRYAGAGRTRDEAYAPVVVEVRGRRVAFVAVTAIWNQDLAPHPGREHVADADADALLGAIRAARALADWVIVSHHGGDEYVDSPREGTRRLLESAIEAGADAVVGHHPHVVQRAAVHRGCPILFSLGNLLMRMKSGEPWTEYGMLARLRLRDDGVRVAICPHRNVGLEAVPLGREPDRAPVEAHFRARFDALLRDGALVAPRSGVRLGPIGDDGCGDVEPLDAAATHVRPSAPG